MGVVLASEWGGWGGAGGAPLGRALDWSGRAGRTSALPPPLLGAWRWAGRSGAWDPSWWLVPLMARASCLSVGSGSRWSSVLFARSASRSLVLPRNLVAAVSQLRVVTKRRSPFVIQGYIHSSSGLHTAISAPSGILIAVIGAPAIAAVVPLPDCRSPNDLPAYPMPRGSR